MTIGVDPSTKTGVAIVEDGEVLGTTVLISKKLKGLERAGHLASQLLVILQKHDPNLVVFEGYGYANSHTLVTLVEIGTVLRYFTKQQGIPYIDIAPTSLKKFVTGKGNAKKDVMMLEVYKRWGLDGVTNDEADAVGLAMFGQAMHGMISMPQTNMEPVLKAVGN